MTHHIAFPDDVYQIAERAAKREGVSPEEWIVAAVSRAGAAVPADDLASEPLLSQVLHGLVGVVDNRTDPRSEPRRTAVGDLIAEKFRKQAVGPRHGDSD